MRMSAYVSGPENRIVAMPGGRASAPQLTELTSDLEALIATAKDLESALSQERVKVKKLNAELSECREKLEQSESDYARIEDSFHRSQRQFQVDLAHAQRRTKDLGLEILQLQDLLKLANEENAQMHNDRKTIQIEAELGLQKNMTEHLKAQDVQFREALKKSQELSDQNKNYRSKLQDVQTIIEAFKKREHYFQNRLLELEDQSRKYGELSDTILKERANRVQAEELGLKEKREKELALRCLREAETRLATVSKELDARKDRGFSDASGTGSNAVHLQF